MSEPPSVDITSPRRRRITAKDSPKPEDAPQPSPAPSPAAQPKPAPTSALALVSSSKQFAELLVSVTLVWYSFVFSSAFCYAFQNLKMQMVFVVMIVLLVFLRSNWAVGQRRAFAYYIIYHWFKSILALVVSIFLVAIAWQGTHFLPAKVEALIFISDSITKTIIFFLVLLIGFVSSIATLISIPCSKGSPLPWKWKILPALAFFLVAGRLLYNQYYVCPYVVGREYPDMYPINPDTPYHYKQAVTDSVNEQSYFGASNAWRVMHAKAHGCVKAEFTVNDRLAPLQKYGVFSKEGASFPAYVRFSNSLTPNDPDSVAQVRGMAIKLMNVPGEKLLNDTLFPQNTQDFLLINSDIFFSEHVNQIPELMLALPKGMFAVAQVLFKGFNPRNWGFNTISSVLSMVQSGALMRNPLNWQYFSATPYRFGIETQAVKYSVKPCFGYDNPERDEIDGQYAMNGTQNFLQEAMRRQLKEGDACFDFLIQYQHDACKQPIEDPTISWGDGPWVKLATLRIPKQEFLYGSEQDFCEKLAFNPWNSIVDHKPLGNINKVRLTAYQTSADYRRTLNDVKPFQPTGKENFTGPISRNPNEGTNRTKDIQYATYSVPYDGLPKHVIGLPADQKFNEWKVVSMAYSIADIQFGIGKGKKLKPFANYTTPDDYIWLLKGFGNGTEPLIYSIWKEDWAFAAQWLYGINPMTITWAKAKPLPSDLNLSPQNLEVINKQVLGGKTSFEKLQTDGKIFFADYEILINTGAKDNRVFYAPIVVFYLNGSDVLLPLMIQLTRSKVFENQIYTPKDAFWTWIFARMHVMQADAVVHEMVYHLAYTHLFMEPTTMAFYRQLSVSHPIFKLMKPHFYNTMAINDLGRKTLLKETGSIFDQIFSAGINGSLDIMQESWKKWKFSERSFPEELKSRGFYEIKGDVKDNLPGYYYRDDAFRLWNAIRAYIRSVLVREDVYGVADPSKLSTEDLNKIVADKISKDVQLKNLERELNDPEFAGIPGIPKLESLDSVTDFLCTILFTASVQHSAVNFGQFDYYSFIPNRPVYLTQLMPVDRLQVTEAYIMSALPPESVSTVIIRTAYFLSLPLNFELDPLGDDRIGWRFSDMKDQIAYQKEWHIFVYGLQDIEKVIRKRNEDKNVYYPYLLPNEVAASIAV